jgi:prolipoprotein diacylglyceryltransferase
MTEIGLLTWYIVKAVLNVGPFGVAAFLGVIIAAAFFAGYSMRPKRADKPMGNVKMDHIKYDILPDGTLGPGDPRGLENPE